MKSIEKNIFPNFRVCNGCVNEKPFKLTTNNLQKINTIMLRIVYVLKNSLE